MVRDLASIMFIRNCKSLLNKDSAVTQDHRLTTSKESAAKLMSDTDISIDTIRDIKLQSQLFQLF